MKRIFYCKKCLIPSTKPNIKFNTKQICATCIYYETKLDAKNKIRWDKRKEEFEELISYAKNFNSDLYDILVPVSGGKDSIYQVSKAIETGLRVLAVSIDYGIKTEIGLYNLSLIPKMGANLFVFKPDMRLHKKLIKIGFEHYGDPDLLSHSLLHAYPLRVALAFNIPLVLLGENSFIEYDGGGLEGERASNISTKFITREYFNIYCANKSVLAKDVQKRFNLNEKGLEQYDYPYKIEHSNTKAVFLSHFFPWSSHHNYKIAKKYGFKSLKKPRDGTYRKNTGIDEIINIIHQYLKVLKYGYGRATDHACEDIRYNLITREKGKKLIKKYDFKKISRENINKFCKFLEISKKEFNKILESHRNKKIWKINNKNNWILPGHLID
jgi:N-acetyl sugar amidotransferase